MEKNLALIPPEGENSAAAAPKQLPPGTMIVHKDQLPPPQFQGVTIVGNGRNVPDMEITHAEMKKEYLRAFRGLVRSHLEGKK